MILELKLLEPLSQQKNNMTLHPEIIEILFENRRYIKNVFSDLNGLYDIAHIGLTCIDPSQECIVFSTTPNIEYNLIAQNFWLYDHCFYPDPVEKNTLLWWGDEHEKIAKIKLENNRFTLGMSIVRPVHDFCFIYSFATKETYQDFRRYYSEHLFHLIDIGDYFYKSIRSLYATYNRNYTPPPLFQLNSKEAGRNIRSCLRLVKNTNKIR